ncbi:class I SAM-dependent methyltransferase [Nocardioides marinquilinus]|uniref:Class I SAM-dependent methyltransferase n=2 Tax=Nocardioides marinquilinus TaxID=1210400 RepID=A0ABP9P7G0_9ACTN
MWLCAGCGLAQLAEDPGPVEEQTVVGGGEAMTAQARATLGLAAGLGLLPPGARVVELGSPHSPSVGPLLRERGVVPVTAIDEPVDVVLDVYGLLHEPDQAAALARRAALLRPGGALVLQWRSLATVLAAGQFSELRHGHFAYWSLPALGAALRTVGLGVRTARRSDFDGGTLAAVAVASGEPDAEATALLAAERAAGALDAAAVGSLQRHADDAAASLRSWLEAERAAGRRVLGYGAAGRAVPLLCHADIDADLLPMVADASPAKHGRRLPGTDVAIGSPSDLVARRPDAVLLFVPHLLPELRRSLPEVEAAGGRWWVADPGPRPASSS